LVVREEILEEEDDALADPSSTAQDLQLSLINDDTEMTDTAPHSASAKDAAKDGVPSKTNTILQMIHTQAIKQLKMMVFSSSSRPAQTVPGRPLCLRMILSKRHSNRISGG
jgi:hypothetical protein